MGDRNVLLPISLSKIQPIFGKFERNSVDWQIEIEWIHWRRHLVDQSWYDSYINRTMETLVLWEKKKCNSWMISFLLFYIFLFIIFSCIPLIVSFVFRLGLARGLLENAGTIVGQRSLQWDLSVLQPGLCLRIGPTSDSNSILEFVMDPSLDRGDRYLSEEPSTGGYLQFILNHNTFMFMILVNFDNFPIRNNFYLFFLSVIFFSQLELYHVSLSYHFYLDWNLIW